MKKPTKTKIVTVTVDELGQPVCTPDPVVVRDPHSLLSFQLDTPGYAFSDHGAIVVTDPGTQFPYSSWTPVSSQAALFNLCTENGTFPYTVNLVEIATGRQLKHDPTIDNQTT